MFLFRTKSTSSSLDIFFDTDKTTLTLCDEPVLTYQYTIPQCRETVAWSSWFNAYYQRVVQTWLLYWNKEVYCQAGLMLSELRSHARPFHPWTASLLGTLTLQDDSFLSFRIQASETHGNYKLCHLCWGDTWDVHTGAPCTLRQLLGKEHAKNTYLMEQITAQALEQQQSGERFFLNHWQTSLRRQFRTREFWLTPNELCIAFPQSTICPAVEGSPYFTIPRPSSPPISASSPSKNKFYFFKKRG